MAKFPATVYLDDKVYRVVLVKQGGMGRVWLLEQQFEDSYNPIYSFRLAVKTFDFTPRHFAVEQELRNWVALEHPHVLPLLRIGRLNYRLAAIMPWLQGTVEDFTKDTPVWSERDVVEIARQVSLGLQYAFESHNLVHLDLKPANLLVRSSDPFSIQISDWGISRISSRIAHANWSSSETSADRYTAYGAGTPLYMSPERFSGNWQIAPQADMYALGMIMVELLTGTLPFRFEERNPYEEIVYGTYIDNVKSILRLKSSRLLNIIMSCIHPDVAARPHTYSTLLSALDQS